MCEGREQHLVLLKPALALPSAKHLTGSEAEVGMQTAYRFQTEQPARRGKVRSSRRGQLTPGSLFFCTDSDRSPPAAYSMAIARWCGVRNTSCEAGSGAR